MDGDPASAAVHVLWRLDSVKRLGDEAHKLASKVGTHPNYQGDLAVLNLANALEMCAGAVVTLALEVERLAAPLPPQ